MGPGVPLPAVRGRLWSCSWLWRGEGDAGDAGTQPWGWVVPWALLKCWGMSYRVFSDAPEPPALRMDHGVMGWFRLEGTLRIIQGTFLWAWLLLSSSRDGTPAASQFSGVARAALLSLACFQQRDVPIIEMGDQWIWRLRS